MALVALVVVAVSAVLQRSTQPDTASPAFAARSGLPAGATSSKLAFVSHKRYDCCGRGGPFLLYVMNADGSGKRLLTRRAGGPAWSPDGRKIAFDGTTRDGKSELYVINADGSGKRRLTRTAGQEIGPAWSPDGRKIAFSRGPNGHQQVYVMNADGSGQRRLTHLPAHNNIAGPLTWLPDGKITFVSFHRPNDFDVYLINADGSGQRNLTRVWGLDNPLPVWSPDGQKIAFASKREGNWELYVMNADGSGRRNLTRNAANDHLYYAQPWSPDGRKLVFGRDRNGDGGSDAHLRHQRRRQRRAVPDTRPGTSLVTRRAEDHLHEQARKLGRDLRHERRRQRTAAADTQPGENGQRENGQRLACLVTRAEVGASQIGGRNGWGANGSRVLPSWPSSTMGMRYGWRRSPSIRSTSRLRGRSMRARFDGEEAEVRRLIPLVKRTRRAGSGPIGESLAGVRAGCPRRRPIGEGNGEGAVMLRRDATRLFVHS